MHQRSRELAPRETPGSPPHVAFFAISALLFAASAAATIVWCASMSAMEMPTWTRMPGQSWPGAAASFTGVWAVMMIAMMIPSVTPLLWRYRRAVDAAGEAKLGALTMAMGGGYSLVWTIIGAAIFPLGAAISAIALHAPTLARVMPLATSAVLMLAGAVQFTSWKSCHLVCCREVLLCGRTLPVSPAAAWRHGLRYGVHCAQCCAPLMAMLLALGVMDLRAMAVVTAAITAERLAPNGDRVARASGAIAIAAGILLIARAAPLA